MDYTLSASGNSPEQDFSISQRFDLKNGSIRASQFKKLIEVIFQLSEHQASLLEEVIDVFMKNQKEDRLLYFLDTIDEYKAKEFAKKFFEVLPILSNSIRSIPSASDISNRFLSQRVIISPAQYNPELLIASLDDVVNDVTDEEQETFLRSLLPEKLGNQDFEIRGFSLEGINFNSCLDEMMKLGYIPASVEHMLLYCSVVDVPVYCSILCCMSPTKETLEDVYFNFYKSPLDFTQSLAIFEDDPIMRTNKINTGCKFTLGVRKVIFG